MQVPSSLLISWDDIKVDELIGQGGSGKVYKGMWQVSGTWGAAQLVRKCRVMPQLRHWAWL
jgi:hypothetical protein